MSKLIDINKHFVVLGISRICRRLATLFSKWPRLFGSDRTGVSIADVPASHSITPPCPIATRPYSTAAARPPLHDYRLIFGVLGRPDTAFPGHYEQPPVSRLFFFFWKQFGCLQTNGRPDLGDTPLFLFTAIDRD